MSACRGEADIKDKGAHVCSWPIAVIRPGRLLLCRSLAIANFVVEYLNPRGRWMRRKLISSQTGH